MINTPTVATIDQLRVWVDLDRDDADDDDAGADTGRRPSKQCSVSRTVVRNTNNDRLMIGVTPPITSASTMPLSPFRSLPAAVHCDDHHHQHQHAREAHYGRAHTDDADDEQDDDGLGDDGQNTEEHDQQNEKPDDEQNEKQDEQQNEE